MDVLNHTPIKMTLINFNLGSVNHLTRATVIDSGNHSAKDRSMFTTVIKPFTYFVAIKGMFDVVPCLAHKTDCRRI